MGQPESGWEYYCHFGSGWYYYFIKHFPKYDTPEFSSYVEKNNKGDRDGGELHNLALHEVFRLASEYEESRWRFPNVHGKAEKAPQEF